MKYVHAATFNGSTGSGTHIAALGSKIMHLKLILGHFDFFLMFSPSIAMCSVQ